MPNKRVKYEEAPLVEVICQLRFPTILSINANEPVEFQEAIREEFPLYNCKNEQKTEVLNDKEVRISKSRTYEFITKSTRTKVTVTSSFIAFSTLEYEVWEKFRKVILNVLEKFVGIYKVPFYTRCGLRYKDIITKSRYGLYGKKWADLIQPNVIGISADIEDERIESFSLDAEYKQTENTYTHNMFRFVHYDGGKELSLLLDCDYYCKELTEKLNAEGILNTLHSHSSNFVSNSITPLLETAMKPVEI